MPQVTMTAAVTPIVSHAMAHTRISPVRELEIHNAGRACAGAELSVQVTDTQGRLSRSWTRRLDLAANSSILLTDIELDLLPDVMEQVEEARPGAIRFTVNGDGRELGSTEEAVKVLAGSQWLAEPPGLAVELLAVHVMPNAPQVSSLMPRIAELTGQQTGRTSLDGYQSENPERVDALVTSVFQALQEKHINYAEPPASWADTGQKVRTPASVIDGHLGTCLDTCVVMAAALEQVGVRPQIWLLKQHAMIGYWRSEVESSSITYDASDLMNYVDLGHLALVETTLLTQPSASFLSARDAGLRTARQDMANIVRVLDVRTARRSGITPLPAVTRIDGTVNVVEYKPYEHSVAPAERAHAPSQTPPPPGTGARPAPPRIQQWKNALLDLGLRNRLINFTSRSAVHLHTDPGSLRTLEDHLNAHRMVGLRPADDIPEALKAQFGRTAADLPEHLLQQNYADQRTVYTDIGSAAYVSRLRSLAYKARTIQEETGANNLYLALGSLVWELDGRTLRSPLVLVPLLLQAGRRGGLYQVTGDEAGQSTPNYCLLERLRQSFELSVPGLENPVLDDSGIDLGAAFTAMREALLHKGLPFHVEETADIAILQFAKYRLWRDLDEEWERLLEAPLVRHLALSPTEEFVDPQAASVDTDLEALALECPIPADGSQLVAVSEALAGRTFVLEGPPGTGKSQTIANLLARAVATGKKVLFVAEKRAALDVVSSRVDEVGLGDFTLDLHDKLSKPAAVRRQIAHTLDLEAHADLEGLQAQTEVSRSSSKVLERYARRLHEPNGAGLSLYTAETQHLVLEEESEAALPMPEHLVQPGGEAAIAELRQVVRLLPEVEGSVSASGDAPWAFVGADDPKRVNVDLVKSAALAIETAARTLDTSTALGRAAYVARTARQAYLLHRLASGRLSLELLDEVGSHRWRTAVEQLSDRVSRFTAIAQPALAPASAEILSLPLHELHSRAVAAAQSSFFGRKKRQHAVVDEFRAALLPESELPRKEIVTFLSSRLQLQEDLNSLAGSINQLPGVSLPTGWNPLIEKNSGEFVRQVTALQETADAVDEARHPGGFTAALRDLLRHGTPPAERSLDVLHGYATALEALPSLVDTTPDGLSRWAASEGFLQRWIATSQRRDLHDPNLRSLMRWVQLRQHVAPLKKHGMGSAHGQLITGVIGSDAAALAFERGLAVASLGERRRSQELDAFNAAAHQRSVQRFVAASADVRTILRGSLPVQALSRRTFAGSSTAGQVGRLKRELNRQRGGLSVREMMSQFGELITEIMPCVLVSPDSVARFLPVGSLEFDMVVFDEASQIRVADAVGAIGRGRSVVVVGDSKQMPPTSFAEVTWHPDGAEDEDEFVDVVEDEESILSECVQARVRREWLTWHYRSQDEALIAFSNAHYYDGKLSSFPTPNHQVGAPLGEGYGIGWIRVEGTFLRSSGGKLKRTNPVEAQAVVAEIQRRFAAAPPGTVPSIGVVTFNQQQRAYIETLLRDIGDDKLIEALESAGDNGLFVKNLENVQGDERDVILFSTAFSVNERGVLPLNFGPLNRAGGERRLNVAITRARRQVLLFSSFDPAQLRAEETSSVGVKHLRSYLDMAASGATNLKNTATRTLNIDRHRDEIAEVLRGRGLVVSTDVGLSDFRVDLQLAAPSAPSKPLVAVLLDGPLWATRRTVGDRDGAPIEVLRRAMGWPIVERVWLPEWLSEPSRVVDRLERAMTDASNLPTSDSTVFPRARRSQQEEAAEIHYAEPSQTAAFMRAAAPSSPSPTPQAISSNARVFAPWQPARAGEVEVLDGLEVRSGTTSRSVQRVRAVLTDGIRAETPIHADRLAKLTAGAFGLSRVAISRAKAVLRVSPHKPDSEGFYWEPDIDPKSWLLFRADPSGQRPIDQISVVEVANAMRDLCIAAHGMTEDELSIETLRIFGLKRRTPKAIQVLDQALAEGVRLGRLSPEGDVIVGVS